MALFRFRTRNPQRDRDTDVDRLRRLQQSIIDVRAEMERERDGLRDRYERVTADAAFSQQRLEDGRDGDGASSKIDGMTGTMIRYTKRLAWLQSQIDFVTEIGRKVEAFPHASAEDRAVA